MALPTQAFPVVLGLVAALAGAFANWFYKHGARRLGEVPLHHNWQIAAGLISFAAVLVLLLWAFRSGGRLLVVYPVYATTYIWVVLIAVYLDAEPWSGWQLLGIGLIMLGVALVAGRAPS